MDAQSPTGRSCSWICYWCGGLGRHAAAEDGRWPCYAGALARDHVIEGAGLQFRRSRLRKIIPLNNNRNNRRRGRGNNRSQGGGQVNRIDSRARGNAPQLLEKYRKMAHDASLNGDRVQAEYYLQFADHYFRVIADSRSQREDMRPRRDDQRENDQDGSFFDGDDYEGEQAYRRPEPPRRDESDDESFGAAGADEESAEAEAPNPYEPSENPFTRGNRPRERNGDRDRGEKRALRRPRQPAADEPRTDEVEPRGIDAAVLPPAIGPAPSADADAVEEKPAPRRRGRKPRSEAGDETLEKVG